MMVGESDKAFISGAIVPTEGTGRLKYTKSVIENRLISWKIVGILFINLVLTVEFVGAGPPGDSP